MGAPSGAPSMIKGTIPRVPAFAYDLKVCIKFKLYEGTPSRYNLLRMSKQPHVPAFFGRIHPDLRAPDW